VSARGNIPNANGVYDPASTVIANPGAASPGGSFEIHAVADFADRPTRVLGVRVDHADPLSPDPTGLTLQFSGAIRLAGLENPTVPAVTLVDASGKDWSLTPVHYDSTLGQLSFAFNQALPTGPYTIELTGSGGLVDLAGSAPVASGMDAGVLGSFRVTSMTESPDDLGPIFPGVATSGLTSTIHVDANSTNSRNFVVVEPGYYVIEGVNAGSGVTYTLLDASGNAISVGPGASTSGSTDVSLASGPYTLIFTNSGPEATDIQFTIRRKVIVFSDLLEGGVAQVAALNLRLVTPQANFGLVSDVVAVPPPANPTSNGINRGEVDGSTGDQPPPATQAPTGINSGVVGGSTDNGSLSPANPTPTGNN